MAAGRRRLTEQMVERLRPPSEGRLEIGDVVVPGLVLRVTPRGVKSFSVIYKVPGEGGIGPTGRPRTGRQHRLTLGTWPAYGVKRAREEARVTLQAVSEGRDPRPERREQQLLRHTNTVETVTRRFIKQHVKSEVSDWKKVERCLELHVLPELGSRPLRDVGRADIHELLDGLVEDGRVGTAREVRKHLSGLLNWAVNRDIVTDSPMHGLKRPDLAPGESGRALDDAELRAVWAAAGTLGYPFGSATRLLLLTGQRKSDWSEAPASEIDAEGRLLSITAARFKSRRDHVVPLADPAWEIVEGLSAWEGDDYFLLSTRGGRKAISGWSKPKARLHRLALGLLREDDPEAELPRWRVHDLRVTCKTRLTALGIREEVRDAVLNHARGGLEKIYNRHDYIDEKRAALAAYAEHVLEVVG